ncbi:MAG: DEAD/DEAH box helicase [Bacteroidota bacterium]|nr:DEAD/DEAH box helicase [Bacteroidota bacterium]
MLFEQLNLITPILTALKEENYTTPTPIQQKAIPIILAGRDLLGCAQTGTGKTAAFAIPVIQLMTLKPAPTNFRRPIRTLVLTPTRELAIQISESFTAYGRHTGLKNVVVYGGVGQKPQTDALKAGVDILIATPGRLLDLMNQGHVRLEQVEFLILDEADRMLDMGFVHDVKKVIAKVPAKRQTLFFSATMPQEIVRLSASILTNPEKVEVTPVSSTANTIRQELYFVDKGNKKLLLIHLLNDPNIITSLVFTRTKHGADRVTKDLIRAGVRAEAIHGDKSQTARQRALSNFKAKQTRVLVATDIAARGIDVDDLSHVINYEIPNVAETYVHRIGRTGRAGASGIAISFCDNEERAYVKDITKLIGKQIPIVEEHPYKMGTPVPPRESRTHKPASNGNGRNRSGKPKAKSTHTAAAPQKKSWFGRSRSKQA